MPRLPLRHDWAELEDEALLDVRMADLPLAIEDTLAERVAQLREELEARGLRYPLHFYLSDDASATPAGPRARSSNTWTRSWRPDDRNYWCPFSPGPGPTKGPDSQLIAPPARKLLAANAWEF